MVSLGEVPESPQEIAGGLSVRFRFLVVAGRSTSLRARLTKDVGLLVRELATLCGLGVRQ